jgi:hypothetical protein
MLSSLWTARRPREEAQIKNKRLTVLSNREIMRRQNFEEFRDRMLLEIERKMRIPARLLLASPPPWSGIASLSMRLRFGTGLLNVDKFPKIMV